MESKPIYKSKTVWFNVLLPLVVFAAYKVTGQEVPSEVLGGALAVMQTVGNIILRLITKQPIE